MQDFCPRINMLKGFFFKKILRWLTVRQKLGMILENKVVQKLKLEKNLFYKKWSPKLIFLNEFFFEKIRLTFWHWKLTLKVRFWHFLTNCNSSKDFLKQYYDELWFVKKCQNCTFKVNFLCQKLKNIFKKK